MTNTVRYVLALGFVAGMSACDHPCPPKGAVGGVLGDYCDGQVDPEEPPVGAGCQAIDNPDISLQRYERFTPAEKRNNPEAGDPDYIFLAAGREAVVIDGPTIMGAAPLQLQQPAISIVNPRDTGADGYRVVVNRSLSYAVPIDDFEYEVTLARVEVCDQGGAIQSRFIFAAAPAGDGVAHDLTIIPVVGGSPLAPSIPYTIEVR
jgi:hypothetical protein